MLYHRQDKWQSCQTPPNCYLEHYPSLKTLESSYDEYEMETSYSAVTHEISCPEDEDTPSMYPHDHHGQVDCTNMAYVLTS